MGLASPPSDPSQLRDFPVPHPAIGPRRPELFRIYRHRDPRTGAVRAPFHFTSVPETSPAKGGRYDLSRPRGACYLALSTVGAWLEVFRTTQIVAGADVRRRRLLRTRPPRRIRTADLLAKRARKYGVTGEIHTTTDYALTRAWAARLQETGFRALLGKLRHDPGLRERSLTLLDTAGEHEPYGWRWQKNVRRVDRDESALAVVEEYGYRVLDPPVDVRTDEREEPR